MFSEEFLKHSYFNGFYNILTKDYPDLNIQPERQRDPAARRKWLRYLRLRLAIDHSMVPSTMVIKVDNVNHDNFAGSGGFCDLLRGTYNGISVALKRYRISMKNIEREEKVCMILG